MEEFPSRKRRRGSTVVPDPAQEAEEVEGKTEDDDLQEGHDGDEGEEEEGEQDDEIVDPDRPQWSSDDDASWFAASGHQLGGHFFGHLSPEAAYRRMMQESADDPGHLYCFCFSFTL